jgi:hypothetical protein
MKKLLFFLFLGQYYIVEAQSICMKSQLPAALQPSLVAFYPFCGTAQDVSGNNYNGAVTNATLAVDRFGTANSCYSFNGANTHIETSTAFFNNSWNQYTIAFWFNSASSSVTSQNCFNTIPHNSIGVGYNYSNNKKVQYAINSNPSVVGWDMTFGTACPSTLAANQWNHVALVKNGSVWTEYLNGAYSFTYSNPATITNTLTNINMGSIKYPSSNNYGEFFNGMLDDYFIYNRALSPGEVILIYQLAPLGIDEIPSETNFKVFPNPANDKLNLLFEENITDAEIRICDVLGKEMFTERDSNINRNAPCEINTSGLKAGVYFISVKTSGGTKVSRFQKLD